MEEIKFKKAPRPVVHRTGFLTRVMNAVRIMLPGGLEQIMHRMGWTDVWYAHSGRCRCGNRWHVGVWSGKDNDLLCILDTNRNDVHQALMRSARRLSRISFWPGLSARTTSSCVLGSARRLTAMSGPDRTSGTGHSLRIGPVIPANPTHLRSRTDPLTGCKERKRGSNASSLTSCG